MPDSQYVVHKEDWPVGKGKPVDPKTIKKVFKEADKLAKKKSSKETE
jgi:hypothetical protein